MEMRCLQLGLLLCSIKVFTVSGWEVMSPSAGVKYCDTLEMFNDLEVNSFIDRNRYIRLNISWGDPTANFSDFGMVIDTNCSALYGGNNISVDWHHIIVPDIERLRHPAEPLLHWCNYTFQFTAQDASANETCLLNQVDHYQIPDCVEGICDCSIATAPLEYASYRFMQDSTYAIKFKKTDRLNDFSIGKVFDKMWITSMTLNKTVMLIHQDQLEFDKTNNVIYLTFPSIMLDEEEYIVNIALLLDFCEYHSSFKLRAEKPKSKSVAQSLFYTTVIVVVLCVIASIMMKKNPKLLQKIKSRFPFIKGPITDQPPVYMAGATIKIRNEIINTQYTPLEFLQNYHKMDEFEIPRNKIILKGEIGGGAFGKVYKADVYDISKKHECIQAAVKKPFENAPDTEISDFLDEIATMKKIAEHGGHQNVIKLLACVTLDAPYVMIMELAPCGSLKSYLSSMRKEWEERKRQMVPQNQRHFFPDNMIVEHYLPGLSHSEESEKLKYTHLMFNDYTGSACTSETNSYVTPDSPETPSTPGSTAETSLPLARKKSRKGGERMPPLCLAQDSPATPNSSGSSGLPSVTETLLTPLESVPVTPFDGNYEHKKEQIKPMLSSKTLQNFALQIANGMAFLENLNITHRDLATRNILLNQEGVLKISDFGMARAGVYVNSIQKRQPLRWMAPEAIEKRTCNNKTDVWSFGVVLWEIGSLGSFPYKELSNDQVIAYVLQGERLERPETCTDQLYELMLRCWRTCPDERPQFSDISRQLDVANAKLYVDFGETLSKYDIVSQPEIV